MLVTASWFEPFKKTLGLRGVSQVWSDAPAWYFWISEALGVYQLQLEEAAEETGGGVRGVFSVRCYPYPGTAVYNGFSAQERGVAESDLFDHTHTPRAEAREQIPDNLFNVAVIECVVSPDGTLQQVTLESLDRMIVRDAGGVSRIDPAAADGRRGRPGDVCRSVCAWELAYPLFDRLVCLWIHYRRQKPARVHMTRAPGFETVIESAGSPATRDTDAVSIYTLTLEFAAGGIFDALPSVSEDANESGDVVFDHRSPCGHFHPPETPIPLVGTLNPSWWSLADVHFTSDLSSTCGCDHDH